jgi:ppGpp synthetase/RelA/SpoT-type nucleotidyltranferase
MIYPSILERKYQEYFPFINDVSIRVKETLINFCEKNGYAFISRIKTIESLAEKIETGRFRKWSDLDDLFACTVIIPTLSHEDEVIKFCKNTFNIIKIIKRGQNKKPPDTFRFDSTRIYALLKSPDAANSDNILNIYDIKFEIQVKSAFEHAWAVSTHDLVYKNSEVDWRRLRLASQIKATVEQLDMLILAFEKTFEFIEDNNYDDIRIKRKLASEINKLFDNGKILDELKPKDMSRFCDNLYRIFDLHKHDSIKETTLISTIKQEINSTQNAKIPRSISLFQYFVAILIDKQIIELSKSNQYYFHITDEFKSLYPSINTDINYFEYTDTI